MFAVRFDGRGGQGVMTAASCSPPGLLGACADGTPGFWAGVLARPELAGGPALSGRSGS